MSRAQLDQSHIQHRGGEGRGEEELGDGYATRGGGEVLESDLQQRSASPSQSMHGEHVCGVHVCGGSEPPVRGFPSLRPAR